MKELIYIDNSATLLPKHEEFLIFGKPFYRHYGVNPGRSGYDLCMEAKQMVQETRKLLTDFFKKVAQSVWSSYITPSIVCMVSDIFRKNVK